MDSGLLKQARKTERLSTAFHRSGNISAQCGERMTADFDTFLTIRNVKALEDTALAFGAK